MNMPTCETCSNNKICVRSVYQDNCLLHPQAEKYFENKILNDLEKRFREADQMGDSRPWNIRHIEGLIEEYRNKLE
jgi:hypothetical protein